MPKRLKSFSLPRIDFPASDFRSETNSLYSDSANTSIRNSGLTAVRRVEQNSMRQSSGSSTSRITVWRKQGMPQLLVFLSTIILFASTICRLAPVAVVYLFVFFVVHQLSYNYLSAWIVTFTCLAIASSVACIFHALIFISALISSFVLPEFVVRIFEPVDVVDVSTFCLYVLPDIIVAIFSIATLYYTMRERSRMANSLELVDNTDHGQEEKHGIEGGFWRITVCFQSVRFAVVQEKRQLSFFNLSGTMGP